MGIHKRTTFIPTENQQKIFDDYVLSQRMEETAQKFGISRQRVHQVVKLFGYKKPKIRKPSSEERRAIRLAKQIALFWSRVDIKSEDECWEWKNGRYPSGYGHASVCLQKNELIAYAHRIAWILTYGDPGDMDICHTCDNPPCCNPKHLFLGTAKDNTQDAIKKGRFHPWNSKGENHRNAKLKESDVIEIRRLYRMGNITERELGERYSVKPCTIDAIINNRNWKHLKEPVTYQERGE